MKKILQLSNIVAFVITIIMNYLSNTGVFNESTMASVSARYQNYFTPAGYAFSIWGFIYIGLAAFIIYQSKGLFKASETPVTVSRIGWTFVISCLANCLWILAWLYDYTGLSVVLMTILLVSLLRIVILTRMELDLVHFREVAFVWWPFSLYTGWITVAIIANIAAYLTKLGWNGGGISFIGWTTIMLIVATAVHLFLTWNRNMRETAFVGAWGIIAVAVSNWNHSPVIVNTALAGAVLLFISSSIHGYRNRENPFIRD